jgi:hypothetical protein
MSRLRWPTLSLFFALVAIVQTWPLAKHAGDSIEVWSFFQFDAWAFLWNMWWVKRAVLHLDNPFYTDHLYYPQGSNLYLHPLTFINGLMSIPFQVITGNLILSWNLVALVCFVLAGLGTYALVHRVTQNHFAGVLAGLIFAFAPMTMMRFGGHWNMVATWPIPFLLLFLLRFKDSGRFLDAIIAGLFWAILTLNWLEFATDAALLMGIFFAYWTVVCVWKRQREELRRLWLGGALIAAVWLILSAPYLAGALRDSQSGDYYQPGGDESFSADLLAYVTPSPLWGPGESPRVGGPNPLHQAALKTIEGTAYLGILPLLLGVVAITTVRRDPHRVLPWLIGFLTFAVLALGPHLWINEKTDFSLFGISFSVPLPYQLYDQLPLLGNRRVPVRMIVLGIMALSVLAGIGLDVLMRRFDGRWRLVGPVLALLALGLVWLEYWNPPVYASAHASPAVFSEIRADSGDFVVVHAPLGRRTGWTVSGHPSGGALDDYYQPLHGKPSPGGYLSRVSDKDFTWFLEQPGLHFLACPVDCVGQPSEDQNLEAVRGVFRENRIRYVIVHRLGPDGLPLYFVGDAEVQAMDRYLRDVVGMEQIYTDPTLSVYRAREDQ